MTAAPPPLPSKSTTQRSLRSSDGFGSTLPGYMPRAGEVIAGKYQIDHKLGEGAMSVVFQVTHRVTQKRFALKWLLPHVCARPELAQRFLREAQVAGRVEHPNLVEVYDVGSLEDSFYMVLELLSGESLEQRLSRVGCMSVADSLRLLLPCLAGIAAAHEAGIVHRDLKPANIFVCSAVSMAAEHAKVLDFGISKLPNLPGDTRSALTRTGLVMGTPRYMPLEQMRGKPTDQRADIYALGVVLYQMLSGRLPYPQNNFGDLLLAMATDPPRPLEREVRGLPAGLPQVIDKALSRAPDDRYSDVEALLEALAPFADDRPPLQLTAAQEPATPDASRWRPTVGGAAGLLLLAAAGLSFGLLPSHDSSLARRSEPPLAVMQPEVIMPPEATPSSDAALVLDLDLDPRPALEPAPDPPLARPLKRPPPSAAQHHVAIPPVPSPPPEPDAPAWRVPVMTVDEF